RPGGRDSARNWPDPGREGPAGAVPRETARAARDRGVRRAVPGRGRGQVADRTGDRSAAEARRARGRARPGMARVTAAASSATPQPNSMAARNPASDGRTRPPMVVVISARITPTAAADTVVPIERIRVLNPLADAVSDGGTALMIRAGIAP